MREVREPLRKAQRCQVRRDRFFRGLGGMWRAVAWGACGGPWLGGHVEGRISAMTKRFADKLVDKPADNRLDHVPVARFSGRKRHSQVLFCELFDIR